ncbi:MAG: hypothetical protein ACRC5T_04035 [Cetobacterium sp.]
MKKEMLMELKNNYELRDELCLESKNYKWIITKETNNYRLNIRQLDNGTSNLGHLEGHYTNVKDIEKAIFERVTIYEFIKF